MLINRHRHTSGACFCLQLIQLACCLNVFLVLLHYFLSLKKDMLLWLGLVENSKVPGSFFKRNLREPVFS